MAVATGARSTADERALVWIFEGESRLRLSLANDRGPRSSEKVVENLRALAQGAVE